MSAASEQPFPPPKFFGRRWNSPAFRDAVEVPVPFGAACLFCHDLIDETDDGLLQVALMSNAVTEEPIHIECHLRSILGSVAHLERRCTCFGGGDPDGTDRADARAVMDWVIREQVRRGLPNPGFVNTRPSG